MRYISDIHLVKPIAETSYLAVIPAIQAFAQRKNLPFTADVTFFVGENGSGKSTLLEAIASHMALNLEGGNRNFHFSTYHKEAPLADYTTLSKIAYPKEDFFFKAESFFNAASYIEDIQADAYGHYGERPLHDQSHGEGFLALLKNRFRGKGLYLLDEPESALSPTSQFALLAEIHTLVRKKSQFIIATHSPILLAYPNALIYELSSQGICETTFQNTQMVNLYKDFLDAPERFLNHLFQDDTAPHC
ncbi:MAG: AAA family ATPase [Peptococcaceae bacterium]|nr:AAA family ATPase [Peptococcaceae bacterium]